MAEENIQPPIGPQPSFENMARGLDTFKSEIQHCVNLPAVHEGNQIIRALTELRTEMNNFKTELRTEMNNLKTELRTEMTELRTEMNNGFARQETL